MWPMAHPIANAIILPIVILVSISYLNNGKNEILLWGGIEPPSSLTIR